MTHPTSTPNHQPGDPTPREAMERLIRVNQAGEYGAKRIYQGQIDVFRRRQDPASKRALELITHMAEQEETHLQAFNDEIVKRRVRPTLMTPLWHVAGYAMGAATAMLGTRAAMACTVGVESVIDEHYAKQLDDLDEEEAQLKAMIARFREEEMEHHDTGLEEGAEQAPAYPLLVEGVKTATRLAIWLSKRV
jgi:ubiquinone biosynthesis monooxygenase Coq7